MQVLLIISRVFLLTKHQLKKAVCDVFAGSHCLDYLNYLCPVQKQQVLFRDLGAVDYQQAWDYQEQLLHASVAAKSALRNLQLTVSASPNEGIPVTDDGEAAGQQTTNHLLFVEHPPVYTLGKSGQIQNLLIGEEERNRRGIEFYKINRGGDITFHGPGQIVGYPILDLEKFYTDIGKYLRNIEEVIIRTLAGYGLKGERSKGETGVWLDPDTIGRERKICAIGVRCSRWITMHGFAFNVNTDLDYFSHIIPCGIRNKQVTSLQKELGTELYMHDVKQNVLKNFVEVFEVDIINDAV